MTNFNKVKEFHNAFGLVDPTRPKVPSNELIILRNKLLQEEYSEALDESNDIFQKNITNQEIKDTDLHSLAKELADLLYVTYGYAAALGIDLDMVFDEVHRSNMSKLGENGKPIYREDGKVLKGPNYSPANIIDVIEKMK